MKKLEPKWESVSVTMRMLSDKEEPVEFLRCSRCLGHLKRQEGLHPGQYGEVKHMNTEERLVKFDSEMPDRPSLMYGRWVLEHTCWKCQGVTRLDGATAGYMAIHELGPFVCEKCDPDKSFTDEDMEEAMRRARMDWE